MNKKVAKKGYNVKTASKLRAGNKKVEKAAEEVKAWGVNQTLNYLAQDANPPVVGPAEPLDKPLADATYWRAIEPLKTATQFLVWCAPTQAWDAGWYLGKNFDGKVRAVHLIITDDGIEKQRQFLYEGEPVAAHCIESVFGPIRLSN